jgi:hypothetical protein
VASFEGLDAVRGYDGGELLSLPGKAPHMLSASVTFSLFLVLCTGAVMVVMMCRRTGCNATLPAVATFSPYIAVRWRCAGHGCDMEVV